MIIYQPGKSPTPAGEFHEYLPVSTPAVTCNSQTSTVWQPFTEGRVKEEPLQVGCSDRRRAHDFEERVCAFPIPKLKHLRCIVSAPLYMF